MPSSPPPAPPAGTPTPSRSTNATSPSAPEPSTPARPLGRRDSGRTRSSATRPGAGQVVLPAAGGPVTRTRARRGAGVAGLLGPGQGRGGDGEVGEAQAAGQGHVAGPGARLAAVADGAGDHHGGE